jgi:hypothetical protein
MRDNLGGRADDYDIIKDYYEIEAGDSLAWDELVVSAAGDMESTENYQRLLGNNPDGTPNPAYEKMINAENLLDYIMMNMYAGTGDWDYHNWYAARRKTDSEGFHFLVWDAERVLSSLDNVSWIIAGGNENRPTGIFAGLIKNSQFKDLFIRHVNRHFFEGGALTPDPGLETYEKWLSDIDTALIADQARWVWDDDDIWNKRYHKFIYDYFPQRTEIVFNQFISNGLYPAIDPPQFNTEDNVIPVDFQLLMSSPQEGEIRYTTDGTDPGHFSILSDKSIFVYNNEAIPLTGDTLLISARVKKDTLWSKLVTREFLVDGYTGDDSYQSMPAAGYFYHYPNPVMDFAHIIFSLSQPSHISMKVYNMTGELVAILEHGMKPAGEHSVTWSPPGIPPGVYICVLENLSSASRNRLLIIKE